MQPTEDRTQTARALLLTAGALLGLVGMAQKIDWLIYTSLGILAAGAVLALMRRVQRRRSEP